MWPYLASFVSRTRDLYVFLPRVSAFIFFFWRLNNAGPAL